MNKRIYILVLPIILIILLLTAFSGNNADYPEGAPAGYTGSPGDGQNCSKSGCHNGTAATVSDWITSDIPPSGYTPGSTYNITVTVTGSGNHGFEVSPQNTAGNLLGTLIAGPGNELTGNGKYVTHSYSQNGNPQSWNFQWVAPATGTGTVTFYGAFCVKKSQTKLSTLIVNEGAPFVVLATAVPSSLCAGEITQLNVAPTGGYGTYTYSWTSIPAGFTSNIQNPTAVPFVTTKYIANVNDGSSSVADTVQVDVTPMPTVNTGNDTIFCNNITQFPVNGTATDYSSVLWTSSGTGTFSNTNSLNTIYYPAPADKITGFVNLYLTVNPLAPCTGQVSDEKHIQFDPCNGIQESDANSITVQPNPSNGLFTLSFSGNRNTGINISIYDINGKVEYAEILNRGTGELNKTIDLTSCQKGIHFLKYNYEGKAMVRKLIIR